ncbi:hypothetical protein HGG71_05160 [Rhodobacteraceae bacterium R_SAG2]|nr:hypothetical protein [Rhodobacteraceae bacterium R_SAG2]
MEAPELKPCPFCGTPPSMEKIDYVYCDNPLCPMKGVDSFRLDAWNNRHTYRQARESADGVKVKPLVWECEGGWRWKGTPPDGFFASVAKWVWQAPKGGFKHAGCKDPLATLEEAKAAAQADYEARIKAALVPND